MRTSQAQLEFTHAHGLKLLSTSSYVTPYLETLPKFQLVTSQINPKPSCDSSSYLYIARNPLSSAVAASMGSNIHVQHGTDTVVERDTSIVEIAARRIQKLTLFYLV